MTRQCPARICGLGRLVGVVYNSPNTGEAPTRPTVLVRSTDRTWTHFVRSGSVDPAYYNWNVSGDTIWGCVSSRCVYTPDSGATWRHVDPVE